MESTFGHITREYIEEVGVEYALKDLFLHQKELCSRIDQIDFGEYDPNEIDLIEMNGWLYISSSQFFDYGASGKTRNIYFIFLLTLAFCDLDIKMIFKRDGEHYLSAMFTTHLIEFTVGQMEGTKKPKKPSKTYLMRDSNTGYTKIGKSVNPMHRETVLQSEKPTIQLFAVCEDNIESKLHKKFKHCRIRGEWFDLSNNEILDLMNEHGFNCYPEIVKETINE